ncbi:LamB/YcsF family protein [Mangrovicoccus algicola]|uniref:5-oxoprolinase subunit A n=1 Tax=Mangrovicoccus algicola TaxID=2771008 RepID=A0A8J6Z2H0_9RHOB|nr:5-oxoprolinase subunit PxpA [Mangrovicoccus algicola]MBE3640446.1 LamB/YcsF family protein [Mangrovicoccus algicola]
MTRSLDLNCDMGESLGAWTMGEDAAMLDLVSSANIACGFHAGDPPVMRRTIRMARDKGVRVGAHPGFADLYGFGRRRISGERPQDLEAQLIYQIVAMQGMCAVEGHAMTHVKFHGALSNMACEDADLAALCAGAIRAVDPSLVFVTMPYSELAVAAQKAGLAQACEIFADRSYGPDGRLTPRSRPGAVIHDPAASARQVLEMVVEGRIPCTDGSTLPVAADTLCVHGDTPGAVEIARTLRAALEAEGVAIAPFGA